jgi:hypothetical protein
VELADRTAKVIAIAGTLQAVLVGAAGGRLDLTRFPRDLETIITCGLELPVVRSARLTAHTAQRHLCALYGDERLDETPLPDRELFGLLHLGPPANMILLQDGLSSRVANYVLAHELGHFLADISTVEQLWLKSLPERRDTIQRLFRWEHTDPWLDLHALLRGLPARPEATIERAPARAVVTEREILADLIARELLAPWEVVAPLCSSQSQLEVTCLLRDEFGLPARIAWHYAADLDRSLSPQSNLIERLFSPLLA